MVMMGRTPHVRPILGAGPRDRQVVAEKMELTATLALAERPFSELSGGEKQILIAATQAAVCFVCWIKRFYIKYDRISSAVF